MTRNKRILIEASIAILLIALALTFAIPRFMNAQSRRQVMQRLREIQTIADACMQFEIEKFPNGLRNAPRQQHISSGFEILKTNDYGRIDIPEPDYPVMLIYNYTYSPAKSETPTETPSCTVTFAVGASRPPSNQEPRPRVQNSSRNNANKSILDFFDPYDISNGLHSEGDLLVTWMHRTIKENRQERSGQHE